MTRKKTAAEHIRNGDPRRRGIHTLDLMAAHEPKFEQGLECPNRLKGDGRAIFRFLAEQLEHSGLAAKVDSEALAVASIALATSWKADRHLQREGEVRKVPICAGLGNKRKIVGWRQQKNRWWSIKIEALKTFKSFASAFGVTGPSSRAGLEVASMKDPHDELMRLLMMPRCPPFKPDPPQ